MKTTRQTASHRGNDTNAPRSKIGNACILVLQGSVVATTLLLAGASVVASVDRPLIKRPLAAAVSGYIQQRGTKVFRTDGGFLTPASTRAPDSIALDFIRKHPAAFGLQPADVRTLVVDKIHTTPHNGAHYVSFGQRINGLRVHHAVISATLDAKGRLVIIGGRAGSDQASGIARISAAEAIARSAESGGFARKPLPQQAASLAAGKHSFDNVYARGLHKPRPLTAELVWHIDLDRSLRLAWLTEVEISGQSWHESVIDAQTGAVLARENLYSHSSHPRGRVFVGQHPDDSPPRQMIDFTQWVTVLPGATTTSGNNVNAYQDRGNSNTLGYQPLSLDGVFDFGFSDSWRGLPDGTDFVAIADATWNAALDTDRDFAITQLFHYTNDMHDWLYGYGFDEPSGNFQVDNFGLGGSGGDPVLAEAHDGIDFGCLTNDMPPVAVRCANNANFGTPADGGSPRMQMYLWIRPNRPYRDGSLDGDVIAHEYGHGVSNRLVPGALSGGTNQAGSLGEGWSDAISLLRWGDTTVGEYVTGNATSGIRNFAYDVHPWTYGQYSTGVTSPHRNGEIWAATMYDIRTRLGIDTTAQLILDGMRSTLSGPTPTFLDARNGILVADQVAGSTSRCALWAAFANRGMGETAQSNGLHAVPSQNFDAPANCLPIASAGGPYNTPEGQDVLLSAAASAKGTHASAGAPVLYEWDLDNDGQYDDATGLTASFTQVGQDGLHTVGLRVTDAWGLTSTATSTVTVTNVLPTVTINAISAIDEHGTVTVSGTITDPGWLEPLSAAINFDDGAGFQPLTGTLENTRPDASLNFSVQKQYGDNGNFQVQVCGRDIVGGIANPTLVCKTSSALVNNVIPAMAIVTAGAEIYDGKAAFVLQQGHSLTVPGSASDPGSDDLTFTWNWDDGTPDDSQTSLVNPPAADPAKSPSVQPRDVLLQQAHAYEDACLYEITLTVEDDDGGKAADSAAVVVTGNATRSRGSGWWLNQYRNKKPNDFSPSQLQCYLDIVTYFSKVFDAPLNRTQAEKILHSPSKAPPLIMLREQLLAAWLNFANGAIGFHTPVDSNGNGSVDTTFGAAILQAEIVAVNPASTAAQIQAQKAIVERIVLRDE
ncbi:hypothetical protein BH23PSE2_BH23PSE2_05160 [soil metagenome]